VSRRTAKVVCHEASRIYLEAYELGTTLETFIGLHYSSYLEKQEEVKNTDNLDAERKIICDEKDRICAKEEPAK
jgi:hypothetical protein